MGSTLTIRRIRLTTCARPLSDSYLQVLSQWIKTLQREPERDLRGQRGQHADLQVRGREVGERAAIREAKQPSSGAGPMPRGDSRRPGRWARRHLGAHRSQLRPGLLRGGRLPAALAAAAAVAALANPDRQRLREDGGAVGRPDPGGPDPRATPGASGGIEPGDLCHQPHLDPRRPHRHVAVSDGRVRNRQEGDRPHPLLRVGLPAVWTPAHRSRRPGGRHRGPGRDRGVRPQDTV